MMDHTPSDDNIRVSNQPKYTPEELQVIIRCRRSALIKGTIFGSVTCGVIYWLKAQGRGPSFIRSSPSLAYSLGFFFPFVYGAGSAAKCITEGILSLENSPLANRYREVVKNRRGNQGRGGLIKPPQQQPQVKKSPPSPVIPSHDESMQSKRPHFEPKSPEMRSGPTAGSYSYNKERALLDTRSEEAEEQLPMDEEQPDAFGGSSHSPSPLFEIQRDQSSNGKKKGRTFDEIREERRRGNSQHRSFPIDKPAVSSEGTKPKRYNKYGDEIQD